MTPMTEQMCQLMTERFGRDCVITLATAEAGIPYARWVNAFYEDGAFYIVTHSATGKMRQIRSQPVVAIAGEWFTGHGTALDMGWFGSAENRQIAAKLQTVFAAWLGNGHTDLEDEHTRILCVRLTDGVLLSHGTRHAFDRMNA